MEAKGSQWLPCKANFLPEASFESWGAYRSALAATPARFLNRVCARSSDFMETHGVVHRSKHSMRETLTIIGAGVMLFGIGVIIGAGIFVLTGQAEAHKEVGPAVILSYVAAGISAMLSVFCYTEFAVEIPVAGGSFAYLRVELGDFIAFIAAGNIILEYIIGGAAVGRSWSSYFATLCGRTQADIKTSLAQDFNLLDPIAVAALVITGLVATWSTRATSLLNWTASIANMVIILFVIVAGLVHAEPSNLTPFLPFGVRGVFMAASVLFFAYLGFDAVATMAEETKSPGKDIPIRLLGSMIITTVIYCLMVLTLSMMQNYKDIHPNAAFSLAFQAGAGWKWAQYLVALVALKGMTTVLLVNAVGQARYVTHIARTHMIPPWFAKVSKKTGTPIRATLVMFSASAIVAFFTSLDVLANLLSISTLFIFMLVAVALLVRRYYVAGHSTVKELRLFQMFLVTILLSSGATAYCWATYDGWIGFVITVPIWFLATLGLAIFVPKARQPQVWGTPFVPWLPSLSIIMNVFLLGSIDRLSFARFGVWTLLILVYYILFGLHASYDTAMDQTENSSEEGRTVEMKPQTEEKALQKNGPNLGNAQEAI